MDITLDDLKEISRLFDVNSFPDDNPDEQQAYHLCRLAYFAKMPGDTLSGDRIYLGWASDDQQAGSWVTKIGGKWHVDGENDYCDSLGEVMQVIFA